MDFIGSYFLENLEITDRLLDFFEESPDKVKGTIFSDAAQGSIIAPDKKKSTEVVAYPNQLMDDPWQTYCTELKKVVDLYVADYPWCNKYAPWGIVENVKIQQYLPGEGFFIYHTERGSSSYPQCARHLVFMTYLNSVHDEGETEFFHQGLKVKPEKGKTLIWPADWTHTHRGLTSPTEVKTIVTGWFNFVQ